MKRISFLTLAVLLGFTASAAVKMSINGKNIKKGDVVEKDGVYTIAPSARNRIQIYPRKDGSIPVLTNAEVEISAEVSGSGNIQLGGHHYNSSRQWKFSKGGKIIRLDAEESETVKIVIKVTRADITSVLPWISVYSGKVNVEELSIRLIGALDKNNLKTAPVLPKWSYSDNSKALKCVENNGTLEIVTGQKQIVEMIGSHQAAANGDVFKFSGNISGNGRLIIGLHLYNKSNVWQGTQWHPVTLKKGEVPVLPGLTVKTPEGKEPAAFIRPVIRITPNTGVTFSAVKVAK